MTTMTMDKQTAAKTTEAATILQRAVCLTLTRHYLGNSRKIDVDDLVEMGGGDGDGKSFEAFTATKKLIDNSELLPCMRLLNHAMAVLRKLSIPTHRVFGERTYLIPLANVRKADDELSGLAAELRQRAAALAAGYREAVERQREKLGPLFKESDYLSPAQVAQAFGLDWSYVSFAAPENLETIDHAMAEAADRKYQEKLASAYDEVRQTLRETALRVARALANKLGETKNGHRKAVRGTALDELREFVTGFQALDLTNDAELAAAMETLRAIERGVTVEDIRDNDRAREQVVAQAEAAIARLEVLTKTRRISLDENDL